MIKREFTAMDIVRIKYLIEKDISQTEDNLYRYNLVVNKTDYQKQMIKELEKENKEQKSLLEKVIKGFK